MLLRSTREQGSHFRRGCAGERGSACLAGADRSPSQPSGSRCSGNRRRRTYTRRRSAAPSRVRIETGDCVDLSAVRRHRGRRPCGLSPLLPWSGGMSNERREMAPQPEGIIPSGRCPPCTFEACCSCQHPGSTPRVGACAVRDRTGGASGLWPHFTSKEERSKNPGRVASTSARRARAESSAIRARTEATRTTLQAAAATSKKPRRD
jgi:hypothetical protein